MKKNHITERLNSEAARYTEIAKTLALQCLTDPYAPDVEAKKRKAQSHALRAETFKEAAAIAAQPKS